MTRLRACQRGAAAIEFALVAPVIIALIFGVVEYGRYLWIKTTIEQGVESAARYGVFQNKLYNDHSIGDWVVPTTSYARAKLYGLGNLTVTVEPKVVNVNGIGMIEVKAQYAFDPILPGITFAIPGTVTVVARQPAQAGGS